MITAWLRIHYAIGGTTAFLRMLQKYPDPSDLYRALETRAEEHGLLGRVSPERFFAFDIPQALAAEELCRAYGWRIIPFTSALYPDLLRRLKNPPAVLFARGSPERLQNPFRVAVVGTRAATRRAADAAALLGEALSRAGVTVVSGGAYGVDSAAALGAGGVSGAGCVTVLGRGFSPAADAGLREGDVIVGIGDQTILGAATLRKARGQIKAGESAVCVYWREGTYYTTEIIRPKASSALK